MKRINLIKAPNQRVSTTIDGVPWVVILKAANGVMTATVKRDGKRLFSGQRIVAGAPFVPYRYLCSAGMFAIVTPDDELPWWEEFGDNHRLVFMSAKELGLD